VLIALAAFSLLTQGCAGPARKEAVPPTLTSQSVIPGLSDVRYRVGFDNASLLLEGIAPFAFLAPAYDENLRWFYATVSPEDLPSRAC
jgi:hypothetical protein